MTSQKKILIINDIGGSGGAEKILMHFSEFLHNKQYKFDIYLGTDGILEKTLGSFANVFSPKRKIKFAKLNLLIDVLGLVKEKDYDFIVLNSLFSQILCSPLSIFYKTKIIWYQHNIQTKFFRKFFMIAWFNFFGSSMIAVSSAVKKSYMPYVKKVKIYVLHNGIYGLKKYNFDDQSAFKKEMGIQENEKLIIAISRLTFYKGLHILIRSFMTIDDDNLKLFIVGDSGESNKDKRYKDEIVKMSNQDKRIHFLGWRDDIDMLLNIADLFIAPAVKPDPFPTTILEAMSIGKCCLVSDIGGQPEAIDNQSGIIFKPNRPDSLKEEIINIIYSDKRIKEFEANSEIRYRTKFTFDCYKQKLSYITDLILQ